MTLTLILIAVLGLGLGAAWAGACQAKSDAKWCREYLEASEELIAAKAIVEAKAKAKTTQDYRTAVYMLDDIVKTMHEDRHEECLELREALLAHIETIIAVKNSRGENC